MIDKVRCRPLRTILVPNGNVLKAINSTDDEFLGFGEVYFSEIENGCIKGWKLHHEMTCNLVVPHGKVKFVVSKDMKTMETFLLGEGSHALLTIPPNFWFSFKGMCDGKSIIMNLSNIIHDTNESEVLPIDAIPYCWAQ